MRYKKYFYIMTAISPFNISRSLLFVMLLLTTLAKAQESGKMYINASTANIRENPTNTAKVVVKLHAPAPVTVYDPPLSSKYAKNAAVTSKWAEVSYCPNPYAQEVKMWHGWVDKTLLVASRDSVKAETDGPEVTFMPGDPLWPTATVVSGNNSLSVYGSGRSTRTNKKAGASSKYQLGPRGGCYYYNSSGNKVYVDRSLCK
jgi:hypothetical protein